MRKSGNWLFDGKEIQTKEGTFVKWYDHQFFLLMHNGKKYHGWQMQPRAISVQEKLNNALSTIFRQKIEVVGAGRTDTGVHASQMFAHFDIEGDMKDDIVFKLDSILPDDIAIHQVFLVDNEKHARFDAVSRTYQYKIWLGRNPFLLDFLSKNSA